MAQLRGPDRGTVTDFDRTTTPTPVPGAPDRFTVEHGVLAGPDGTLVAESFQTRLTTTD